MKFGQRLRKLKQELENIIQKVENERVSSLYYAIHVDCLLDDFVRQNENKKIMIAALSAKDSIDKHLPEKKFWGKTEYISGNTLIKIIRQMLKTIDAELPDEEQIDILEDEIKDIKIFLSKENNDRFLDVLHKKARVIAKLLVKE